MNHTIATLFLSAIFLIPLSVSSAQAAPNNSPVNLPALGLSEAPLSEQAPAAVAAAVDNINPLRFLVGLGLTFGGDDLLTIIYTDGATATVKAGGGFMIYAGAEYRLNENVSLQATLGYHDDSITAKNAEASFSRIPLEFMGYFHVNDAIRLGAGTRFVSSPKLTASGGVPPRNINQSFDSTIGLVIEGEWLIGPRFGLKLRNVSEKYKAQGFAGTVSGNHTGIMGNFYF